MNLTQRLKAAIQGFTTGRTQKTVPDWAEYIIGHPFIPPETLDGEVEAFRKVPIVSAAIGRVQHDVASLPWRVWRGKGARRKELERQDGNLADLLSRANPRDSGYQLRVETVGDFKMHGNAYWYLQRFPGAGPQPREIWPLKAHLMEVVPGEKRGIYRYFYNRGGNKSELDPRDIIHFRKYNPDDHPVGMSELEPVRKVYQAKFYAFSWVKEFFFKGGSVPGVWTLKDGSRRMTDVEIDAIVARLKKFTTGINNVGNPAFVDAALEFVKRGMTMSDMELDTQLGVIDAELCRAIGVPPWMMGIKEGSTLGTSGATVDQVDYVLGTLKREAMLIDTTVNEQLAPLFGPDLEVETDFSGHLAIQGAMLEQAKGMVIATGRAVLTVNEGRKRLGVEEHDDPTADDLYTKPVPAFGEAGAPGEDGPAPRAVPASRRAPANRITSMIDGNEQREALRRRAASALDRATARMEGFIRARLAEQQTTALRRLAERWENVHGSSSAKRVRLQPIDIDKLMDGPDDEDKAKVRRMLAELLRQRGKEAISELAELVDLAEAIELNLNAERVQRFLDTQVERAIIVPDGTTAAALRESLNEGVGAGESLGDLTERVRSVFTTRENMAATIARTETLPGFNLAAQEAWAASGVVDKNEWLSARDDVVREGHAKVDGEQAVLGTQFSVPVIDAHGNEVGRDLLEYPGDPRGSAENVINCRCTLIPVVSEELRRRGDWETFWKREAPLGNGHVAENRMRQFMGAK